MYELLEIYDTIKVQSYIYMFKVASGMFPLTSAGVIKNFLRN